MTEIMGAFMEVAACFVDLAIMTGEVVSSNNILLVACVGVPLCGLGVGMFKRLLSSKA